MKHQRSLITIAGFLLSCSCNSKKAETESPPTATAPTLPAVAPPKAVERQELPATKDGNQKVEHVASTRFGQDKNDTARALASTPDGDLILGGYSEGKDPFDESAKRTTLHDAYLAKMSPQGELRWSLVFGGTKTDTVNAVASDHQGNVVATGIFAESLKLGQGTLQAEGADDIYLAKFDADGKRLWAKSFGSPDVDVSQDVATDSKGNIYLTGEFRQTIRFGEIELKSSGDNDMFVVKCSPTGKVLWAKAFGSSAADVGRALAIDSQDDIVIAAEFSRQIDFGLGPVMSNGNSDVVLFKLNPEGQLIWNTSFGNNLNEFALDVAVESC